MMNDRVEACQQILQSALQGQDALAIRNAYTDLGLAYFQGMNYQQALQCFEQLLMMTTTDPTQGEVREDTDADGVACCHIGLIYRLMGMLCPPPPAQRHIPAWAHRRALVEHTTPPPPVLPHQRHVQCCFSQFLGSGCCLGKVLTDCPFRYAFMLRCSLSSDSQVHDHSLFLSGDYNRALLYHQRHLMTAQRSGNLGAQGMAYSHMGNTYESLGHLQQALDCHKVLHSDGACVSVLRHLHGCEVGFPA